MKARFAVLFALSLSLGFTLSPALHAAGSNDVVNDNEDVINETDAAVAEIKDFKQTNAKQKAQAEQRHETALKNQKAAAAKRQASIDEMHATEAEIVRLKTDTARLDGEIAQTDKITKENRAKNEKMKIELAAIKKERTEKAQRYLEIASERDKAINELKTIEDERAHADTDLQAAKAQDKTASEQVAKLKQELQQKKVKLDAYLVSLKERYRQATARQAQLNSEKAELERNTLKLEAQAKAGEAEVAHAENPSIPVASVNEPAAASEPESAPAAVTVWPASNASSTSNVNVSSNANAGADRAPTSAGMTFKRKCRVFDGPVRGANVVAVRDVGMSVAKSDEGKQWIAFQLQDGRKAFAAKNCFR